MIWIRQNHAPEDPSSGEKQTLALARSLMSRQKLLKFDEVFLGLTPRLLVGETYRAITQVASEDRTPLLVQEKPSAGLKTHNESSP